MITRLLVTNYRSLRRLDFAPNQSLNILIGANDSGKSTVIESIALALSGRANGRWASDEMNPHWFNAQSVEEYFNRRSAGETPDLPEICIELYMAEGTNGAERLRGVHNERLEDVPGLRIRIHPDPDRASELAAYLAGEDIPRLIPTELYVVDWRSFSDEKITRQPVGLGHVYINASMASNSSGIDYKLRQLLRDFVTPQESAEISLAYRRARSEITDGVLADVDRRIHEEDQSFGVGLQMDQGAGSHWTGSVTPHVNQIPFALLGQGHQVRTKVALSLSRNSERNRYALLEEPENHLSHSGLQELLGLVQRLSEGRQLFITTHSSFVLNRLGFDHLFLMREAGPFQLGVELVSEETVRYFKLQSGYDTLRLALAEKTVIVEGPSDEMIFNRAFKDAKGLEPREFGVDVISMGTRGKRALELAHGLNKTVAVLRDNDGETPEHWRLAASAFLAPGKREMFIGVPSAGWTLEPQIVDANRSDLLERVLGLEAGTDLIPYMLKNKTEAAWKISTSAESFAWPSYITDAIEFISGD